MTNPNARRWQCIDPALGTYRFGPFEAQRTIDDTVALWRGKQRIGTFPTLDAAMQKAFETMRDDAAEVNA